MRRMMGKRGLSVMGDAPFACSAAAVGAAVPGTAVPPVASTSIRGAAAAMSASASFVLPCSQLVGYSGHPVSKGEKETPITRRNGADGGACGSSPPSA